MIITTPINEEMVEAIIYMDNDNLHLLLQLVATSALLKFIFQIKMSKVNRSFMLFLEVLWRQNHQIFAFNSNTIHFGMLRNPLRHFKFVHRITIHVQTFHLMRSMIC